MMLSRSHTAITYVKSFIIKTIVRNMVVAPSVCNVILCPTVIFVGKMYLSALVIILHFPIIFSKPDNTSTFKIALIHQDNEFYLMEWSRNILNKLKPKHEYDILDISIKGDEKIDDNVFGDLSAEKPLLILDASWYQKEEADVSITNEIPYFKMDLFFSPFVEVLEKYLETRNAGDILMILEKSQLIDNFLYFWIRNSRLRMYLVEWYDSVTMMRLRNLRPTPTNYVLLGSQATLEEVLNLALQENAFELSDKFLFISTEVNEAKLNNSLLGSKSYNLLQFSVEECCRTRISSDSCLCEKNLSIHQLALNVLLKHTVEILDEIITDSLQISNRQGEDDRVKTNSEKLEEFFIEALPKNHVIFQNRTLKLKYDAVVENINKFNSTTIAKFVNNEFIVHNESIKPMRAFFRVGIAEALPWSFKVTNSKTGTSVWTGYCADFTEKLSEMMNFDYEFVEPINGSFGEKINGVWNGVIGDLVSGKTDLAISAITMTADREEVVDFVAPYFEQTGITIVMRKPVRKTSLFKFMTVLKLEVWLSIVMALVITGCMVWFLDKYSPYSARNNKEAYPYPCRLFSIKESFWFALTSFTPQGGGEAPKALSGRTLVAAYWLFVVLMLATFTANLAAFLTVERMQAPVQSLEQLARQSRINYTVVEGSDTHKYFINMKNAEDILYRMWKELTLNASSDDTRYRVWDYPIKEQYGHILLAINDSKPVSTAEEGFEKVNEHLNADYAFIHDSSEIKYKISHNCNLTEVGEVFAERPYAVAVQQGSYLQDEISKVILKLQKDRFFDFLHGKYWNHSKGGYCPNTDDNEGITLESLGGVFIATLFGLALALMTLAAEVFYYRKQHESTNKKNQQIPWNKNKTSLITSTLVKPTQDKLILNSFASIPKSSVALGFRKNNRIQFLN